MRIRATGQQAFFTPEVAAAAAKPTLLARLSQVVRWEDFRPALVRALPKQNPRAGGRPRWDPVLLFKMLVLKSLFNLSDEQTEAQALDRLSFQRFLGLSGADGAPDARTLWRFQEELIKAGAMAGLWDGFRVQLYQQGIEVSSGVMVDATFVEARRPQNTREENEALKRGEQPTGWDQRSAASLRQKDRDARYTRKYWERHYGYKNHVKADIATKLIIDYRVTSAEVHDSIPAQELAHRCDSAWYADKGYDRTPLHERLAALGIAARILRQAQRNHPLSEADHAWNHQHRTIRARVEHVFAALRHQGAHLTRVVGRIRTTWRVGMNNLVYNLRRLTHLVAPA